MNQLKGYCKDHNDGMDYRIPIVIKSFCKKCKSAISLRWFNKNKAEVKEYQAIHKEKIKEYAKNWYIENRKPYSAKLCAKSKLAVSELKDSYIIALLKNKGYKASEITDAIIRKKRLQLQAKRERLTKGKL